MFTVHSHARKHVIFERQRNNPSREERLNNQLRSLQMVPDPGHARHWVTGLDTESGFLDLDKRKVVSVDLSKGMNTGQHVVGKWLIAHEHVDSSVPVLSTQKPHQPTQPSRRKLLMETQANNGSSINPPSRNVGRHFPSQPQQRISPQTILSARRVDPFQSYPIESQPYVHYLVDHCKTLPLLCLPLRKFREKKEENI
jgi:hypothetical protein